MLSYLIKQSDAGTYNATACVGLQFENGNTHDYVLIERKKYIWHEYINDSDNDKKISVIP